MPGMSKMFTYIIHSFVPQIFIEHGKGGLYDTQGSVQGENMGALVLKQEDFYFPLWLLSPPSWYLFHLLFNVAFLKQRRTSSASTNHRKCPMPHSDVIEAVRARSRALPFSRGWRSRSANSEPGSGPLGREWGERWISAFSPEPFRPSGVGPAGELQGPVTG